MSKYWSKIAAGQKPYVPGEQPKDKKYIKLNTNECPYTPSPLVLEAIKEAANEKLKLYPDPGGEDLRQAVAEYYGLKKEWVFVGNGSDEILAFAFMAFFDPGRTILFPDVTYSFYPVYANLFQLDYRLVPLREEFSLYPPDFYGSEGGVIFPNPNAPTGNYVTPEMIEKILIHNMDKVVIVDEAYIDFGGETAIPLIEKYPNLLVIQTLSKSRSLAGLRVGFALGQDELMEGLSRIKNSFNSYTLDRLSMAGAIAAMKDESYFQVTRQKVMQTRERIVPVLRQMGWQVIPSQANFIFISHPVLKAEEVFTALRQQGILVRYFRQPKIDNYLRVSIGSDEEMDSLLQALTKINP
ncbi:MULTISPECIES: histidinol-phosphate transaminase [unclassified Dehalobacter]|uniref:histidinol-phosphate transaminase n=1 Tax=unclassified Dehalobacter TaxID=2635733 RepID=UPI00047542F4|nr:MULTISPECIES: histidinol-phosphate transaminase [unclassified Dehalobacter]